MPMLGLAIAGLAIGFGELTDKASSEVLFSGQSALPDLLVNERRRGRSARCCCCSPAKGLAYGLSLSAFRGGPVFPSMFLGAAGGIAAVAPARAPTRSPRWRWASARCAR